MHRMVMEYPTVNSLSSVMIENGATNLSPVFAKRLYRRSDVCVRDKPISNNELVHITWALGRIFLHENVKVVIFLTQFMRKGPLYSNRQVPQNVTCLLTP